MSKNKKQSTAVADYLKALKKDFGNQASTGEEVEILSWITTGSLMLDYAIAGQFPGGWPSGRIVEIMGPTSEGKSTIIYHGLRYALEQGGIAVLFDTEGAYEKNYGTRLGMDNPNLIYVVPETAEAMFSMMEKLVEVHATTYPDRDVPMVMAVDSIAALVPQFVMSHEPGEKNRTTDLAMCLSKNVPRINAKIARQNVCIIGANQLREKPGMAYQGGGEYAPGGRTWGFYSSIRLAVKRKEWIGEKDDPSGIVSEVSVVKNRVGRPNKKARLYMYYDYGIADAYSWFDFLVDHGVITKNGSWYSAQLPGGERKWQGIGGYAELICDETVLTFFRDAVIRAMQSHDLPDANPEDVALAGES